MKIIFVAPSIKTGGGNRVFIELANQLCNTHNVCIVYPNNSFDANTFHKEEGVQLIKIGKLATSKLAKLWNMICCIRYLNKLDSTFKLICSDPIFCLLLRIVRHQERVYRFIQADDYRIYDDGNILGSGVLLKLYKRLCLYSYQQKINFIFNSHFVYETFCTDAHRTDVIFRKVYPAINHIIFAPATKTVSSDRYSLCLIARRHRGKGLDTFINVFRILPDDIRKKIINVTLVSHDDLSGFDTQGMTIVRPTCDEDIAYVYQNSDIFISTSWREGFGLPPLEAMACGCAVICSDSGGVREYAKSDENCLMFQPKNEEQLKDIILKLLSDRNLRETLAVQGIKTAKDFSWKDSAKHLLDIIK